MWDANKDKLICMLVVDDKLAEAVMGKTVSGYWRGFVMQNRETGEVRGEYRFKYANGDRNWHKITMPSITDPEKAKEKIHESMEQVLNTANELLGLPFRVEAFFPPDDGGDPVKTIEWLEKKDLIEVTRAPMPKGVQ